MDDFDYQMVPNNQWTEVNDKISVFQSTGNNVSVLVNSEDVVILPILGGHNWMVKPIG